MEIYFYFKEFNLYKKNEILLILHYINYLDVFIKYSKIK